MTQIAVIPELDNGGWPQQFNGMWMNIFTNLNRNAKVFSLYNNDLYNSGEIIETENSLSVNPPYDLPDAYVSVSLGMNIIYEIYVRENLRGNKIGTMLAGFSRSYFLKNDIIIKAPEYMNESADLLYKSLSVNYGEEYMQPNYVPLTYVYTDFGGGWGMKTIKEIESVEQ